MVWKQRGSWECCANPLSFLDFKLDNYFCICSLLSCRLGFSSPRGSHGWLSLITYEMWFFSWGSHQIPVQCPASVGWIAATQLPAPKYTDVPTAHLWECRIYSQQRLGGSGNMGVSFSCGSASACLFWVQQQRLWLCRPSQRPFGGISNPAIITSALLPAARTAKS